MAGKGDNYQNLGEPRLAARALREVLARRVNQVVLSGGLDLDTANEFAKIGANLLQLERAGFDLRSAGVEICRRLAEFAKRQQSDPGHLAWLTDLLAAFFQTLEEEG